MLPSKAQVSNGLEKVLSVALVGYVLMVYFYPDLGRQQSFFYFAVLPFAAVYSAVNFRKVPVQNQLLMLNLAVITYLSLSVIWGPNDSISDYWKLAKRGVYVLAFILAVTILLKQFKDKQKKLVQGYIFLGSLSATISLVVYFQSTGLTLPRMSPYLSPHPIFGSIAYGIPLVCALYLSLLKQTTAKASSLYLLASLPLLVIMLLTQSRGPLVALAPTIAALALIPSVSRVRAITVLLGITAAAVAIVTTTNLLEGLMSRGLSYRTDIWSAILAGLDNHWILGEGWSMQDDVKAHSGQFNHAHSFIFGTLRHAGIIGCLLVLIQLYLHLLKGFGSQDYMSRLFSVWLIFGISCLLTDSNFLITRPEVTWFAYWLPLTAICMQSAKKKGFPCADQVTRSGQNAQPNNSCAAL